MDKLMNSKRGSWRHPAVDLHNAGDDCCAGMEAKVESEPPRTVGVKRTDCACGAFT
jgi:hypothetical protein